MESDGQPPADKVGFHLLGHEDLETLLIAQLEALERKEREENERKKRSEANEQGEAMNIDEPSFQQEPTATLPLMQTPLLRNFMSEFFYFDMNDPASNIESASLENNNIVPFQQPAIFAATEPISVNELQLSSPNSTTPVNEFFSLEQQPSSLVGCISNTSNTNPVRDEPIDHSEEQQVLVNDNMEEETYSIDELPTLMDDTIAVQAVNELTTAAVCGNEELPVSPMSANKQLAADCVSNSEQLPGSPVSGNEQLTADVVTCSKPVDLNVDQQVLNNKDIIVETTHPVEQCLLPKSNSKYTEQELLCAALAPQYPPSEELCNTIAREILNVSHPNKLHRACIQTAYQLNHGEDPGITVPDSHPDDDFFIEQEEYCTRTLLVHKLLDDFNKKVEKKNKQFLVFDPPLMARLMYRITICGCSHCQHMNTIFDALYNIIKCMSQINDGLREDSLNMTLEYIYELCDFQSILESFESMLIKCKHIVSNFRRRSSRCLFHSQHTWFTIRVLSVCYLNFMQIVELIKDQGLEAFFSLHCLRSTEYPLVVFPLGRAKVYRQYYEQAILMRTSRNQTYIRCGTRFDPVWGKITTCKGLEVMQKFSVAGTTINPKELTSACETIQVSLPDSSEPVIDIKLLYNRAENTVTFHNSNRLVYVRSALFNEAVEHSQTRAIVFCLKKFHELINVQLCKRKIRSLHFFKRTFCTVKLEPHLGKETGTKYVTITIRSAVQHLIKIFHQKQKLTSSVYSFFREFKFEDTKDPEVDVKKFL